MRSAFFQTIFMIALLFIRRRFSWLFVALNIAYIWDVEQGVPGVLVLPSVVEPLLGVLYNLLAQSPGSG